MEQQQAKNEFRWEIENFSDLRKRYPFAEKKYITSKNFSLPPHLEWKLRLFPNGNSKEGYLGIFLVPVGAPYKRDISFSLTCENSLNPGVGDKTRETKHNFSGGEDWGFSMFMTKEELTKGFTFGDSITLVVKISEINPQSMLKIHITSLMDIQRCSADKTDLVPYTSSSSITISPSAVSYQCKLKDSDTIDHLLLHLSSLSPSPFKCNNNNDKNDVNIPKNDSKNNEIVNKSIVDNLNEKKTGILRRWELRRNQTLRPSLALSPDKKLVSLVKNANDPIYLYYDETSIDQPHEQPDSDYILIFLKIFDPKLSAFTITSERICKFEVIGEFVKRLSERNNGEEIVLYEEVHPAFIEPILSLNSSFLHLDLLNGDILAYQLKESEKIKRIEEFYSELTPKLQIEFYDYHSPYEKAFDIELNESATVDQLRRLLAKKFDLIEENIALHTQLYNGDINPTVIPNLRHLIISSVLSDLTRPILYYKLTPPAALISTPPPSLLHFFDPSVAQDQPITVEQQIEEMKKFLIEKKKELAKDRSDLARARALNSSLEFQLSALNSETQYREERRKCKKCGDRAWSILLLPCNHQCICNECIPDTSSCPVCSTPVAEHLVPFHS